MATERAPGKRIEIISLPLYLAGLTVTLCGIQAVNMTVDDLSLTAVTISLTVLGFAFSLGCRWLKVPAALIQGGGLLLILYILSGLLTRRMDLGLFVPAGADKTDLQMAVYVEWIAVLLSWMMVSDSVILFSGIVPIALIGLVAPFNPNEGLAIDFCLFLFALAFLLIHQNYLALRAALPVQRTDGRRLIASQAVMGSVYALVLMSLGTLLTVPFEAAFRNLSLAQALHQLVAAAANPGDAAASVVRFSDTGELSVGTGSGWSADSDILMHVAPSDGQEHLWRGRTYDLYTGDGWKSTQQHSQPLAPAPDEQNGNSGQRYTIRSPVATGDPLPAGSPQTDIQTQIEVKAQTAQVYYTGEPRTVRLPGNRPWPLHQHTDGCLDLIGLSLDHTTYSLSFAPSPDPSIAARRALLKRAGTDYPPEIRQLYLPVRSEQNDLTTPSDIAYYQSAVAEALRGLPPNRRTPVDEAFAIRDWVAGHCLYSLDVNPLPDDVDHVHEFLQNTQKGYCDLFASSMAVLCRTAGIPARLATGFAPGDRDDHGFNLRVMDKHAWVEVYFPGPSGGWYAFDPTAGTRADASVPTPGGARKAAWGKWLHGLTISGPVPLVILALIMAIAGYLLKVEVYDRIRLRGRVPGVGAAPARTEIGRLYREMSRALSRLGVPRRPAETPGEYAVRAADYLRLREQELGVPLPSSPVHDLTARFVLARYGGDQAAGTGGLEASDLEPSVRQFLAAAARARRVQFRHRLRRLPPARTLAR